MSENELELKGNELGWLIKLADAHYFTPNFQTYLEKNHMRPLGEFLRALLCKVHPDNFCAGGNTTTWIIKRKKESSDWTPDTPQIMTFEDSLKKSEREAKENQK